MGRCWQARRVLWTYHDSTAQLMPVRKFSPSPVLGPSRERVLLWHCVCKCEQAPSKGFLSVPSISLCVSRYPVILAGVAKVARLRLWLDKT